MAIHTLQIMIEHNAFDFVFLLGRHKGVLTFAEFEELRQALRAFPPHWVNNATVRGNVLLIGK